MPAYRPSGRSWACRSTASSGRSPARRSERLSTGRGDFWVPRRNLATLESPDTQAAYDPVEDVEVLVVPDGDGWQAVYYDSPASLTPKLALADRRGLAGAGFWAVGYERGLPAYTDLIRTFRAGQLADPAG